MRNIERELIIHYFFSDEMINHMDITKLHKLKDISELEADDVKEFVFENLHKVWGSCYDTHSSSDFLSNHFLQLTHGLLQRLCDKDWEYILGNIKVRFYEMEEQQA